MMPVVKRLLDILLAGTGLVLSAPLWLGIAVLVKLEDGGALFFGQERVGRGGRHFQAFKFRSMIPDAERISGPVQSAEGDARVTRVGRVLRATAMDELPQLWNIVRGDMSFVGPRPERPFFVDKFSTEYPSYVMRHRVPVGLTGLAQVSGMRGDTPISDRARFDNYYIDNWSLWLDIKVLLRTVAEVFRGGGR
jgi:lipopolysaccharide/colanic/teichoic acid biosynthesis glycosyltransferase